VQGENEVCTGVHEVHLVVAWKGIDAWIHQAQEHGHHSKVHEAVHEEMKCAQGGMGVHEVHGTSTTWLMHDARRAHGGPTTNGA